MLKGIHLTLLIGRAVQKPVPREVMDALTSVKVTTGSGQTSGEGDAGPGAASGFQLEFTLGINSPLNRNWIPNGLFDPPQRIIIVVTLKGTPHVIMDGVVTRQEFAPSNQAGASKVVITGEDLSRLMDMVDATGMPFPAMPAEARIALLLAKYAPFGVVPKIMPSVLLFVPNPLDTVPTQKGTDLFYIRSLAESVGYVFYVEPGPEVGMSTAYWGPEIKAGSVQPTLIVNSDALNNARLGKVSFDGFTKTLYIAFIQEKISKAPIPIPVPDVTPLNPPLGSKPIIPWQVRQLRKLAKLGPLEAASVALAAAAKSADVISGTGTVDVLRYGRLLQARQLVDLRGAGPTLDGWHYVTSVTHTIIRGNYQQEFQLSRNALFPLPDAIASTVQSLPNVTGSPFGSPIEAGLNPPPVPI